VRLLLLRHLGTISCALYAKWLQKWPHSISHSKFETFQRSVGLHLASAYNLARWLTLDENSAENIVEGAYVRAWQLFDGKKCNSTKASFHAIVRKVITCTLRVTVATGSKVNNLYATQRRR
jgi:hypothetical protein